MGGVIWQMLLGALYLGIGVHPAIHPVAGLVTLTLALAIYLFAEGLLELMLSFQIRPRQGWGWLLLDGIVTLILAVMILQDLAREYGVGDRNARGNQHDLQWRDATDALARGADLGDEDSVMVAPINASCDN